MSASVPGYNERSWVIDVISEINRYSAASSKPIARAGGEYTLSGPGSLFPDVLLFGDGSVATVRQGWELKMPDTPIDDPALLKNARDKAVRIGLGSFLVWNAAKAALYVRNDAGEFTYRKGWVSDGIERRADVARNRDSWVSTLHMIVDDLNDLMDYGDIRGVSPDVVIGPTLFGDYIDRYVPALSEAHRAMYAGSAMFAAEVDGWWDENRVEHPGHSKFDGLATVNLISWINNFLFAHYLKRFHSEARLVEDIRVGTAVRDAIWVFDSISAACDFRHVLRATLGQDNLDSATWNGLLDLNVVLTQMRLNSIDQEILCRVIETALTYSRKKLAGQYSTPLPLADLLVALSIEDRTRQVLDPCCGTGTIARAVYNLKRRVGMDGGGALSSTWASDKFSFPLQLCSIALSDPECMGEVVQVSQHDAFDLSVGQPNSFVDPNAEGTVIRALPKMHAVVSNLPFVRFENDEELNPGVAEIRETKVDEHNSVGALSGRADLYAHLVIKVRDLVEDRGRLGVVVSNSWLGSDWGRQFRDILVDLFDVKMVVISGKGRWFSSTKVVTTMLILEKRTQGSVRGRTAFVTTTEDIAEWKLRSGGIDRLSGLMLLGDESKGGFIRHDYEIPQMRLLESVGIGWNAMFGNVSWVTDIIADLVSVNESFQIARGERRGWDSLFYPKGDHGIETEFIRPVLLSARDIQGLLAVADGEAFCCLDAEGVLSDKNAHGAMRWIERFRHVTNGTGKPLPEVLERSGVPWYGMSPSTLADMVISMNPDQRLCVHRLSMRSFVNQRLIRLSAKSNTDMDLCHALLNSAVGMFMIEANGFGRGEGVLDLNATKMSRNMHMLDPKKVSNEGRASILEAFAPLLLRNALPLSEELLSADRIAFDAVVLRAYGVAHLIDTVYSSLLHVVNLRSAARRR